MLRVLSLQVCLIFLFGWFLSGSAWGQRKGNAYNYLEFKNKPYYFGIAMGYASSNYRIEHSNDFILNEQYTRAQSLSGPGLRIGVIGNLKFGEYFDFRLVPGFAFTERQLDYLRVSSNGSLEQNIEKIESTFFELPMLIRYKSKPYKDLRFFILSGIKYTYDISNASRTRQAEDLILTASHDYAFEFGAGVQIFFPYFIFSPQIKVSHGMGNILLHNGALTRSNVIDRINSSMISFSLNFEG